MEFVDPVVDSEAPPAAAHNQATEEQIHKLELEIDSAYLAVEKTLGGWWSSANNQYHLDEKSKIVGDELSKTRQQITSQIAAARDLEQVKELELRLRQLPLDEHVSKGLDAVDSQLEKIEHVALGYALSFASFFSQVVSVEPQPPADQEKETVLVREDFLKQYGQLRYEQELFQLHSDATNFTTAPKSDVNIDVEQRTEEIATLLKKYGALDATMQLVLASVDYMTFWKRYFIRADELQEADRKRQELKAQHEENDDFTWSDDDEDDKPTPVAAPEAALDPVLEKQTPDSTTNDDDDDDEDDDDWE